MSEKYRFDHRSTKHRKRHIHAVVYTSAFILIVVGAVLAYMIISTRDDNQTVNGPNQVIGTISPNQPLPSTVVNELGYSLSLPNGWQQIASVDNQTQNYVTWQSKAPAVTNRYLTIYKDKIPQNYAVNRMLPVSSQGSKVTYGTVSDNCVNFTPASSTNPSQPQLAKWQNVNFWCNIANKNDNQVGTSSISTINSVTLTGTTSGSHQFFFLYIDRNAHPDYTIFYSMLNSFQAK